MDLFRFRLLNFNHLAVLKRIREIRRGRLLTAHHVRCNQDPDNGYSGASAAISVVGVLIATHVVRGQEATSANLPDQFQTGEMIEVQKPKTKKVHPRSKAVATTPKQQIAPV